MKSLKQILSYPIQLKIFHNFCNKSKSSHKMQASNPLKIGFAIDIDGTLILKGRVIEGAKEALEQLIHLKIPYLLLTNNISRSEQYKAEELNGIFKLSQPLSKQQVILNYTPIKEKLEMLNNQTVLVVGRQSRLSEVLPLPFLKKYITVEEYATIFPQTVPLSSPQPVLERNAKVQEIKSRLGLEHLDKHTFKVGSILILTVPNQWEQCFQIILDLLSTEEGTVSKQLTYSYIKDHIPVIAAFNDLSHISHEHNLPRLLMKPFTDSLKAVYKSFYHEDLRIEIYGKPQVSVFEYAKAQLEEAAGPVGKMVMIGDNEGSDILGAYHSGWDSILVKTGVAKHDSKFATVNAGNILEGIEKYLKKDDIV